MKRRYIILMLIFISETKPTHSQILTYSDYRYFGVEMSITRKTNIGLAAASRNLMASIIKKVSIHSDVYAEFERFGKDQVTADKFLLGLYRISSYESEKFRQILLVCCSSMTLSIKIEKYLLDSYGATINKEKKILRYNKEKARKEKDVEIKKAEVVERDTEKEKKEQKLKEAVEKITEESPKQRIDSPRIKNEY